MLSRQHTTLACVTKLAAPRAMHCGTSPRLAWQEEYGVCTPGEPKYLSSGILDGPDWDTPEAYAGGALPDWSLPDPARTGRGAKVMPYGQRA